MGALKEMARSILMAPRKKEYRERLISLSNSFDVYMREQEEELIRKAGKGENLSLQAAILPMEDGIKKISADVGIYIGKGGILSPTAEYEIRKAFDEDPGIGLLYSDEDAVYVTDAKWEMMKKKGVPVSERTAPRLKPIYSPETLISYFYPGNILAIRTETLEGLGYTAGESVYSFLLRNLYFFTEENTMHLPLLLLHVPKKEGEEGVEFDEGNPSEKERILNALGVKVHFEESRYKPEYLSKEDANRLYPVYDVEEEHLLSVVIPSKDNPEVLFRCVESVREAETKLPLEIIVVDNGSGEANRRRIEEAKERLGFHYIYEKAEFNYSHMNNLGAAEASGDLLLLLNDDMELITKDAFHRMAGQLLQEGVGIVGAKLLYPNSTIIQHVGITNAVDGPVHKFIGKDDRESMDYKRNRFVHNCIGATGACLMIRKKDFDALGGLNEDLRVAYNDVDLCFGIREQQKRCVIRPDCVLYHHESLSRGADHLSDEKLKRLTAERKALYAAHPTIYYKDPYEGMAAAGGNELQFDTENRFKKIPGERPRKTGFDYRQYPEGIIIHYDRVEKEELLRYEGEEIYVIQGYHVVPRIDNMRFRFVMVFEGKEGNYEMPMPGFLRMNLEGGYPEAANLKLSGFCNFVTEGELPPGEYEIGIFADDCLKKLYLYQRTRQILRIGETKA